METVKSRFGGDVDALVAVLMGFFIAFFDGGEVGAGYLL
jgi:hypothetical protein